MNSRHRQDRSFFRGSDSFGGNRSFLGHLVAIVTFPLGLLWGFIVFMVQSWATSRSAQAFLIGVPSVLVTGLFLSGLWAANFKKETRSVGSSQLYYESQKRNSPDKPENAEIFARKLVVLKPEEDFFKYQLGEALVNSGKEDEALDVISYLAPIDRPGYADAHVWMAKRYMGGDHEQFTEAECRELAVKHLANAMQADPQNLKALIFKARIHELDAKQHEVGSVERQDSLQRAIECLETVVNFRTDSGGRTLETFIAVPDLVRLLDEADRKEDANIRLGYELKEMSGMARRAADVNEDVFAIWYTLVVAAVQTGAYEQADAILDEGMQLAKSNDDRSKILLLKSQVSVEEAKSFTDMTDREAYRSRIKLLCEAVTTHPQNRTAYLQLLEFIDSKSNPDFNESWLRDSVIEAEPGIIHGLLGVHEIDKGNMLQGQRHWRIAEQQVSIAQFIVAMLIDVASREGQDSFSNLLDMATLAIELFPEQITLYQTRGHVLSQEGNYRDAIADFEHVAEEMPRLLTVRKQLAKCFMELDQPEKAAEQEQIIQEILGSLEVVARMSAEATLENID